MREHAAVSVMTGSAKATTAETTSRELIGETVLQLLLSPPCRPPCLSDLPVAVEDPGERNQLDLPVAGHLANGVGEIRSSQRMTAAQKIDVGEVPPAGVDRPACDGGHDLLGVHHHERVPPHDDLTAEQAGKVQLLGCGSDRVTHVDVDVEVRTGRRQLGLHRDPNAAVGVLVADHRCGRSVHVERDAVVEAKVRHLADDGPDVPRRCRAPRPGDRRLGSAGVPRRRPGAPRLSGRAGRRSATRPSGRGTTPSM